MAEVTRDSLIKQLILHEGKRNFAYMDTVGKVTVGVGRNLSDKGLSDDEVFYLLNNDIDECIVDLTTFPWFPELDSVRQRVLVDLRLNLGPSRFRNFKRTLRLVSEGSYTLASAAMRESAWAAQVKTRADRLVKMMQSGLDYTA